MKSIKSFSILLGCLVLSGCTTYIAKEIRSTRTSLANSSDVKENVSRFYEKQQFCSTSKGLCTSYLYAPPLDVFFQKMQPNVKNISLSTKIALSDKGSDEEIVLNLKRTVSEAPFTGSMILIHGYNVSKEAMGFNGIYFSYLGFNIILPDMLGHGEADDPIGFGLEDSRLFNELLDQLIRDDSLPKPIYVLGNSLGAVAASHLFSQRKDIKGLILQAPAPRFDEATRRFAKQYFPTMSRIFPDRVVNNGVIRALQESGVSVEQTDIRPSLENTDRPVLILASTEDSIAPYSHWLSLENPEITLLKLNGRSHIGMAGVDQKEAPDIQQWLLETSPP